MRRTKRKVSEATTNSEEGVISLLRRLLASSSQDNGTRCIRLGTNNLEFYCARNQGIGSRIAYWRKISMKLFNGSRGRLIDGSINSWLSDITQH